MEKSLIEIKLKTKEALKKLLEVNEKRNESRERWIELQQKKDLMPESEMYIKVEKPVGYSSNNTFALPQRSEKYKKLLEEIKLADKQEDEVWKEFDAQLQLVAKTFLEEYDLNSKHAKVSPALNKGVKKIYHATGVVERDINQIAGALVSGDMHPGRFTSNAAGIAMYWGDINFFEGMKGKKDAPKKIIEATVSSDAKIHEVDVEEYNEGNMDFYKPYFKEEDFNLLVEIENSGAMHVRSILDVAMGYAACVRVSSKTKSEIWAIYDRSALEVSKSSIKDFNTIFEDNRDKKI